jgi:hypothetical protein
MKIYNYFQTPLVIPVTQKNLQLQSEDSHKSIRCPIYRNAVKASVYLCLNGDLEITWNGGHDFEVKRPDWWQRQWNETKRHYINSALEAGLGNNGIPITMFRYSMYGPFGTTDTVMLHQGGLSMSLFTGLSIETDSGEGILVLPPVNRYESSWTIQNGYYDSDAFPGDFSFNLQILKQGKVVIPDQTPICSIIPCRLGDPEFIKPSKEEHEKRWSDSVRWNSIKDKSGLIDKSYDSVLKEYVCPHFISSSSLASDQH